MADDTDTKAKIPFPDKTIDPPPALEPEPAIETAPETASARLRAFEDDVFGMKAPRINGAVERGIGSPYADMTPRQKAHYAALEKLVAAEKTMTDAGAALAVAEVAHAAAIKTADDAAQAMDETA